MLIYFTKMLPNIIKSQTLQKPKKETTGKTYFASGPLLGENSDCWTVVLAAGHRLTDCWLVVLAAGHRLTDCWLVILAGGHGNTN